MKKITIALALLATLSTVAFATAAPLQGVKYNLSASAEKIRARGEICSTPSQPNSKTERSVLLQVWVHPGATDVWINGAKARQPRLFDIALENKTVISQGWVVQARVPKTKNSFSVRAKGYALTGKNYVAWDQTKVLNFSDTVPYWGKLKFSKQFNGICNFI